MVSINPISFNGHLIRQTYPKFDRNKGETQNIETTRDEFINSYDKQIKKIQDAKKYAIQLDDMMHNDKEIQKKIKELPDDVNVELAANFDVSAQYDNPLDFDTPRLFVIDDDRDIFEGIDMIPDKKGPNKKQILNWLNNLQKVFNQ